MVFSLEGSLSRLPECLGSSNASLPLPCPEPHLLLYGADISSAGGELREGEDPAASWRRALVLALGPDPFELARLAVQTAAQAIRRREGWPASAPQAAPDAAVEAARPSFADRFGWCTWDSFYTDLAPGRVLDGIKSLRDAGTPPGFVILDDGWQVLLPLISRRLTLSLAYVL